MLQQSIGSTARTLASTDTDRNPWQTGCPQLVASYDTQEDTLSLFYIPGPTGGLSIVRFSFVVFISLLLCASLSTSTKIFPFLSIFILKGSDPSTATMALFTAEGDSLHKGLSSSVPFTNRNLGHEQNLRRIQSRSHYIKQSSCPFPIRH